MSDQPAPAPAARRVALTAEQRDAVERLGQDVCVVAGPGSGKTRVLVERFRRRVEGGVSPLRILAVTFTEKAANELKQRLARDFHDSPQLRGQIERAPVHTIDGFCARLLREHAIEAGLDPRFEVLDAPDAYAELWSAAEEALDALLEEFPDGVRSLLTAIDLSDPVGGLLGAYQAMRMSMRPEPGDAGELGAATLAEFRECLRRIARGQTPDWSGPQLIALASVRTWAARALALPAAPITLEHFRILNEFDCNLNGLRKRNALYDDIRELKLRLHPAARQALVSEYYAEQRALLWTALERLELTYGARKQALNALDFADLEEFAIRLLRDDERLRARVADSFDEVLMDELQDTNPLQAALIDLVRRPDRFFAVGDINQSIYGFRHADPQVFRDYRENLEKAGKPVDRLSLNHRSRAPILWAAEAVVGAAEGIEPRRLQPARRFAAKDLPSVEIIAAELDAIEDAAEAEAQCVARRIREIAGALAIEDPETGGAQPARYSDIAILVRNVNALPPFEQALHKAGVPYLVGRGKRFYEAQEVVDLVHLLRVIVNPRDEISMAAVLRSPFAGVSSETLLRLKQCGNLGAAVTAPEYPADLDAADAEALRSFRALLKRMRADADSVSPDRLLLRAIDAADYESALSPRYRGNVRKLLARLRDWHSSQPRPLPRLVEELEFLRASDPDEPTAPPDDSSNAVRVMTVHGAKGLEFPIVFMAALHKGVSRESPSLSFSPSAGLVARWLDPVSGRPVKDLPYAAFSDERKLRESEEENRLLYVGMTRAQEHLVLSLAKGSKAPRNWAGAALAGLGVDLDAARDECWMQSVSLDAARRFDVRVWRVRSKLAESRPAPEPAMVAPPEDRLPKPEVADQHDSSASVTSIALFHSCPRRYFLARYIGWEGERRRSIPEEISIEDEPLDASELGRTVHELLAEQPVSGASALALELSARFQMSEIGRRSAAAARLEREFEFIMSVEDVVVEGRIDLWFEDEAETLLVDYKTDDVNAAAAEERASHYALQLQLYALALERFRGRLPDRALVYMLRPNIAVPIDIGPDSLNRARQAVAAFRRAQSDLYFPLYEGAQCRRCAYYRGLCPAGRDW